MLRLLQPSSLSLLPSGLPAARRATGLLRRSFSGEVTAVSAAAAPSLPVFLDVPDKRPVMRMTARHAKERGGDARVAKRAPWIFRDVVDNMKELIDCSEGRTEILVNVESFEGRELGIAACTLRSGVLVVARVLSSNIADTVDQAFFEERIRDAMKHRELFFPGSASYRLLNAEGDMMPGVICDRYGDVICLQFTSAAMEGLFKGLIVNALQAVLDPKAIVCRCDARVERFLEKAEMHAPSVLRGQYSAPARIEDGDFAVDLDLLEEAWVSGRVFEDRELRPCLERELHHSGGSPRPAVLGLFSESLAALAARRGADVTLGVGSGPRGCVGGVATALSRQQLERLAGDAAERISFLELPQEPNPQLFVRSGAQGFDVVMLEPPAFASTYGRVEEGSRLYTAWITAAVAATRPGGLLMISCRSRTISLVRLMRCINLALWSQERDAQVVYRSGAAPGDFPVHLGLLDSGQMQSIALRVR